MNKYDYSTTREALNRVIETLDHARRVTAISNLPTRMSPAGVRVQLDQVERAILDALVEIGTAKEECIAASRQHLRVCD
ncbi:hypothetical protein KHP62_04030 [Rhodobacteraceae bacterium NNCM2]|nr:hypothetical protein [Coraliihabitans acroporae]